MKIKMALILGLLLSSLASLVGANEYEPLIINQRGITICGYGTSYPSITGYTKYTGSAGTCFVPLSESLNPFCGSGTGWPNIPHYRKYQGPGGACYMPDPEPSPVTTDYFCGYGVGYADIPNYNRVVGLDETCFTRNVVAPPPAEATFAEPTFPPPLSSWWGGSASLEWSTKEVVPYSSELPSLETAINPTIGTIAPNTNGSRVVHPSGTTTYTLTAIGAGGDALRTDKTIAKIVYPASISSFTLKRYGAPSSGKGILNWQAATTAKITLDSAVVSSHTGLAGPIGTLTGSKIVATSAPKTYSLTAYGLAGNDSRPITSKRAVIRSFTASPSSLPYGGGSVRLSWSTFYADGTSYGPANGSKNVSVSSSCSFSITAYGLGGNASRSVSVSVAPPPPPDPPDPGPGPGPGPVGPPSGTLFIDGPLVCNASHPSYSSGIASNSVKNLIINLYKTIPGNSNRCPDVGGYTWWQGKFVNLGWSYAKLQNEIYTIGATNIAVYGGPAGYKIAKLDTRCSTAARAKYGPGVTAKYVTNSGNTCRVD
jgi:hypothetical protein